jgi:stage II sporulation protein D
LARAGEVVRIAVSTGRLEVQVSGRELVAEPLRDGAPQTAVPGGTARLRLSGGELLLDGQPVAGAGILFAATGPIRHAGRDFSGEVEVRRSLDGLAVIDVLPLEDYVAAVTGAEMPPSFPAEALKAQAIAARTFAVGKKLEARELGLDYDLGATVLDQVYPGAGAVDPRARSAAVATAGEVLVFDHRPAEAYFHSSCGGITESGADALGRDLPYLRPVRCESCRGSPRDRWTLELTAAELGRLAGLARSATEARVTRRSATGRVAKLEVQAGGERAVLDGPELRRRLGYDRLPSLAFTVKSGRKGFVFQGKGAGHGAGLCQWGAAGKARSGASYRQILLYYYPGVEIVKMY